MDIQYFLKEHLFHPDSVSYANRGNQICLNVRVVISILMFSLKLALKHSDRLLNR